MAEQFGTLQQDLEPDDLRVTADVDPWRPEAMSDSLSQASTTRLSDVATGRYRLTLAKDCDSGSIVQSGTELTSEAVVANGQTGGCMLSLSGDIDEVADDVRNNAWLEHGSATMRVIARAFRGCRLAVGMLLIIAGVLAGCGAPAEHGDGFPVTIAHQFGETNISAAPKRVLSLGRTDQDTILALGVVPIAVREFMGNKPSAAWPWASEKLQGKQPTVLQQGDINPASIAALRPDLIVAISAGLTREQYEWLSKIAPVITQSTGSAGHGTSWQDTAKVIGRALGRSAEADKLVSELEGKISAVKARYPDIKGKSIVLAQPGDNAHYVVWGAQDPRARLFESLGMRVPAEIDRVVGEKSSATVGTEQLKLLDSADVVVLLTSNDAEFTTFQSLPGYSALSVVQRRGVLVFDEDPSAALAFSSMLSLPPLLNVVPQNLASMLTK